MYIDDGEMMKKMRKRETSGNRLLSGFKSSVHSTDSHSAGMAGKWLDIALVI